MDSIEQCRRDITHRLVQLLQSHLPCHPFSEVYRYALLPPGKLFRPLLVRSVAWDLGDYRPSAHGCFELFVEVHHAYTLLHDDLPCMDNDSLRRGREASHLKFGPWQALLAGDGLNTLSFRLLSLIDSPHLRDLLGYCAWALGPKGLIVGQYRDLAREGAGEFAQLLNTHRLKTSRLMQVALVGGGALAGGAGKTLRNLHRLGEHLGVVFQLLDDLSELGHDQLSRHESEVNPFLLAKDDCCQQLEMRMEKMACLLDSYRLRHMRQVLAHYLGQSRRFIADKRGLIESHMGELPGGIEQTLHRLGA